MKKVDDKIMQSRLMEFREHYSQAVFQKTSETEPGLIRQHFTDIKIHVEYISNNLMALYRRLSLPLRGQYIPS